MVRSALILISVVNCSLCTNNFAPDRKRFRRPASNPPDGLIGDRRTEISYFRLLAGHTNTGDHWFRRGRKMPSYLCRRCNSALETAEHLLLDCKSLIPNPSYDIISFKLFRNQCGSFSEAINRMTPTLNRILIDRICELQKSGIGL